VEQVGNPASSASRQIVWRGNVQLRWERPTWSVGWKARFYDDLLTLRPANNPTQWLALQGGDSIPWELEHDLNFSYGASVVGDPRGTQWLLSGTSFAFGVNNVFDRAPRFWAPAADRGVAPFDSIQGRSLWLRVSKDFQ
jgi:outer membrane receptor protein involved in Fe transport